MGLAGAALATVLSQVIGGIFPVIYFLRKNSSLLRLQFPFPMHWKALWIACANGSSEMVSNLSVSLVSMLCNYQLMRLVGEDGISAYGVLMYVSVVFNAVFMGYSIGSAPIVSYHYGAKNHAELKNLFQKGLWLISGSSVVITALAIGFAKQQAMIFTSHDADLMALTIQACQIYSIAYLFKGINTWASSFFTALNNGLVSALISFLRTFLFEIAAILILPALFGVLGILVFCCGSGIGSFGCIHCLFGCKSEKISVLSGGFFRKPCSIVTNLISLQIRKEIMQLYL